MKIIKTNFKWNGALTKRPATKKIVLHHAAAKSATVESIHRCHQEPPRKWVGIGYHFYVRKDGAVYEGRPIDKQGAHCYGHNDDSIGICFEGNFDDEYMTGAQLSAGKELIAYILSRYPGLKIYGHRDFNKTDCPGANFPMNEFTTNSKPIERNDSVNTIKKGSTGTDVKILQTLLNVGGASLIVDGDFGGGTDAAVKAFQQKNGLTADGIVGAKTWEKLSAVKITNNGAEVTALKNKIEAAKKALA